MTTAERNLHQRMTSLEKANYIRMKRAQLKKDLKSGGSSGLQLLDDPPDWLETMRVFEFLMALPRIGEGKATTYVSKCKLSQVKTIGDMTPRQREELRVALT